MPQLSRRAMLSCLCLCILSGTISCAKDTVSVETTQTSTESTETTENEETLFVSDDLPDDLDFGGQEVKILIGDYNNAYIADMYSEEATGNRLSDAVYNTIANVSERLNVQLVYNWETYSWGEMASFQNKVTSGILAGDNQADLIFDVMNYTSQMLEGDYFLNLADNKYIDLDKPWYNQTVRENMPTDYIHFMSGEFSLANIKNVYAVYYNADLYETLGLTDGLYSLVDSGEWTLGKLEELIRGGYSDLNGDTIADPGDRYGLTFGDNNKYIGFLKAFGMNIFKKTETGYEFAYDNERALDVVDRLCRLINENENVLAGKHNSDNPEYMISTGGGNYASRAFVEGRSLFTMGLIADASVIVPEIDFDWGLLPYPKWDETQTEYANMLQRNCYVLIPATVSDPDAAGAVLEALSSESYRSLVPEYCEVTLKTRYSPDDNVSRMFDLIIGSIVYDPGEIYANLLGSPSATIKTALDNNDPNWASRIAKDKNSLIAKMSSIVD